MQLSVNSLKEIVLRAGGEIGEEYHKAKKKIVHVSQIGEKITPEMNCGYKFEIFINSFIPYLTDSLAFLQVEREEEFAPVKNHPSDSVDSPTSARGMIASLHAKWLTLAGANILGEGRICIYIYIYIVGCDPSQVIEISPLISYEGENLEKYKDKEFVLPNFIV